MAHMVLRFLAGNKRKVQVLTGLLRYLSLLFGCEVENAQNQEIVIEMLFLKVLPNWKYFLNQSF